MRDDFNRAGIQGEKQEGATEGNKGNEERSAEGTQNRMSRTTVYSGLVRIGS
jgi:hypothetical protein